MTGIKRKNGRKYSRKYSRKYPGTVLAVLLVLSLMTGCSSGKKENSATENNPDTASEQEVRIEGTEEEMSAEEVADAVAPDGDISQTVTVKADALGNPTEVRVKDSREDLEEKADPGTLPFAVKVQYFLDGKEMTPEKIAGKSGRASIRFTYENKAKRMGNIDGKTIETEVPFVFLSAVILPEDHFSNVEVEKGSVTSFKNNTVAFGYALPGVKDALAYDALEEKLDSFKIDEMDIDVKDMDVKNGNKKETSESGGVEEQAAGEESEEEEDKKLEIPESVEISADVTDFQLDFTATVVMNGLLAGGDLTVVEDVKELKDNIEKFTDAGDKLAEGTGKLSDGADEFGDYLKQYIDGIGAVGDGASKLASALSSLSDGLSKIDLDQKVPGSSGESLQDVLQKITADGKAISDAVGGLEEIRAAAEGKTAEELSAMAAEAAKGVAGSASEAVAKSVYESLAGTSLSEEEKAAVAASASAAAASSAQQAAKQAGIDLLKQNGIDVSKVDTKALNEAASDLKTQLETLAGYVKTLDGGEDPSGQISEIAGKIKELKSGISQLSSGAGQLKSGIRKLSDAGDQLLKGYDALRDGMGELSDGVDEFNEKGIQKLGELAGDELLDTARHLKALEAADRSYTLFDAEHPEDGTARSIPESAYIAPDEDGKEPEQSVRFIVETEEIKK